MLNQALAICENDEMRAQVLTSIGSTYDAMGKHVEALDYYQQALALAIKIGNTFGMATTYSNISEEEYDLGRNDAAEKQTISSYMDFIVLYTHFLI